MIKGSIQEEDTAIVNIYAPNRGAPQHIRQTPTDRKEGIDSNTVIAGGFNTSLTLTDIKGEIDGNIMRVGDFNTPLTPMARSSK